MRTYSVLLVLLCVCLLLKIVNLWSGHVQGNCAGAAPSFKLPPSHAPLRPLLTGQCLLLADEQVLSAGSRLWLDGLYFRLTSPRHRLFSQLIVTHGAGTEVWMTNVTLQGNGDGQQDCYICGVGVASNAAVYAEGVLLLFSSDRQSFRFFCMFSPIILTFSISHQQSAHQYPSCSSLPPVSDTATEAPCGNPRSPIIQCFFLRAGIVSVC